MKMPEPIIEPTISVVAENTPSSTLFLNPGAADSVEWTMNDGSTSTGAAAMLTVKEGKASYAIYRAAKLTDAEKAQAGKLLPGGKPTQVQAEAE